MMIRSILISLILLNHLEKYYSLFQPSPITVLVVPNVSVNSFNSPKLSETFLIVRLVWENQECGPSFS